MTQKLLIPLYGNEIAPRFDLATEIFIMTRDLKSGETEEKIIVLPEASVEKLCHLILTEGIQVVICGGIEEEYYHYLIWKRVKVIDSVIGSYKAALAGFHSGQLAEGTILKDEHAFQEQV